MKRVERYLPSAMLALAMVSVGGVAAAQETDDVIVVRGAFVPDEKKSTAEISNLLDAESFERIGDSDIAGALRRVTGLSITGGRFPVARGLNERYTYVTLNGVPIPSPEPLRRSAPLDIIPTSVLEGSLAQKTFSPQFSGEFGGAAIDLQTVTRPARDSLNLSVGFSVDTQSTLKSGLFHEGSNTDVFGWDDGLRDLPGLAADVVATGAPADQDAFDTSFEQENTLLITEGEVPANGDASATLSKLFEFDNGGALGTVTYVGYSNDWEVRQGEANRIDTFAGGEFSLAQRQDFTFDETRQNIQLNALNSTGYEFADGNHEVGLTTYILRDTLKRSRIAEVFAVRDVGDDPLRQENTDWLEREVWQAQLSGEHVFPSLIDLEASWRLAYGEATREAPYERRTTRQLNPATGVFQFFNNDNGSNTVIFSDLKDENLYAGLDFVLPLVVTDRAIDLKFGAAYTDNSRDTQRTVFSFGGDQTPNSPDLIGARTDLIYSDPVLGSSILDIEYTNTLQEPNASSGSLEVLAAYAMAEVDLTDFLRASVGVRFEDSTQESTTELTSRPELATSFPAIEEDYLLPAITVTWNPVGQFQLRAGFSQTIARPQFRELVFSDFLDLDYDIVLRGNPFLENSEIDNYDARVEWYFNRGEFLTLGAFFKEITNPIEQYKTSGEDEAFSFLNAPSAELWGIEAEFQKTFDLAEMFPSKDWFDGKELFFLTNYTYAQSEVQSSDDLISIPSADVGGVAERSLAASTLVREGRPMVGQSDHLFNLQIGLEVPESGTKVTALLNYASERVLFAEARADDNTPPAIIEQPPVSLDLVMSQDIEVGGGIYGLGIKVQNILGEDFNAFREDNAGLSLPFLEYDRGTTFSISLDRDF